MPLLPSRYYYSSPPTAEEFGAISGFGPYHTTWWNRILGENPTLQLNGSPEWSQEQLNLYQSLVPHYQSVLGNAPMRFQGQFPENFPLDEWRANRDTFNLDQWFQNNPVVNSGDGRSHRMTREQADERSSWLNNQRSNLLRRYGGGASLDSPAPAAAGQQAPTFFDAPGFQQLARNASSLFGPGQRGRTANTGGERVPSNYGSPY